METDSLIRLDQWFMTFFDAFIYTFQNKYSISVEIFNIGETSRISSNTEDEKRSCNVLETLLLHGKIRVNTHMLDSTESPLYSLHDTTGYSLHQTPKWKKFIDKW